MPTSSCVEDSEDVDSSSEDPLEEEEEEEEEEPEEEEDDDDADDDDESSLSVSLSLELSLSILDGAVVTSCVSVGGLCLDVASIFSCSACFTSAC